MAVRTQKVGVIGATGAVGAEMIKVRASWKWRTRHVTRGRAWRRDGTDRFGAYDPTNPQIHPSINKPI